MTNDTDDIKRIVRLVRMHSGDWEKGERLSVSSLGAQVWAEIPFPMGHAPSDPIGFLAPKEEIIYVEQIFFRQILPEDSTWHKVLTRFGISYIRKWAISEPWDGDNDLEA